MSAVEVMMMIVWFLRTATWCSVFVRLVTLMLPHTWLGKLLPRCWGQHRTDRRDATRCVRVHALLLTVISRELQELLLLLVRLDELLRTSLLLLHSL